MRSFAICGFALTVLGAAPIASADESSILAPYRFTEPVKELPPLEQQRALIYRNQLRSQQRFLDQDDARGDLDPLDRRLLLDTRGELRRMNNVIGTPQPIDLGISGSRTLPSLSSGIPRRSP